MANRAGYGWNASRGQTNARKGRRWNLTWGACKKSGRNSIPQVSVTYTKTSATDGHWIHQYRIAACFLPAPAGEVRPDAS